MSGKYLLDTNIIIALFANEAAVLEKLQLAKEIFISNITIGELYYGAEKSQRVRENKNRINELVANSVILGTNVETALIYGEIKHSLRLKGRPLPENDIWIAAVALQYDLILVTRDAHFQKIKIKTVAWK